MNKMNLTKDIVDRYLSKVTKSDNCWEWNTGCSGNGYGIFFYNDIRVGSHRFTWEFFYGPIPKGKLVQHHCDNKKCCNPSHLFLGTNQSNSQDMVNKNRQRGGWVPGAQHPNTQLTETDVKEIKRRLRNGEYQSTIAKHFGVGQVTISRIKLGKTWSYVTI